MAGRRFLRTTLGILLGFIVMLVGAAFTVVDALSIGGTTALALLGLGVTLCGLTVIVRSVRRIGTASR